MRIANVLTFLPLRGGHCGPRYREDYDEAHVASRSRRCMGAGEKERSLGTVICYGIGWIAAVANVTRSPGRVCDYDEKGECAETIDTNEVGVQCGSTSDSKNTLGAKIVRVQTHLVV